LNVYIISPPLIIILIFFTLKMHNLLPVKPNTLTAQLIFASPPAEKKVTFLLDKNKVDFRSLRYDLKELFLDKDDLVKAQVITQVNFQHKDELTPN
jgi:hypothetical protein